MTDREGPKPRSDAAGARPRIAVVVPGLAEVGGVASVAEFVLDAIERSGRFEAKLISLAVSARDASSVRLGRPDTWLRGVRTVAGHWRGRAFTHVGARFVELESRRYAPRAALSALVADCALVQVVCGHPAWAMPFVGRGVPVAIQCATRAIVERRRQAHVERGLRARAHRAMRRRTDVLDDRALERADCVQVENRWMLEYARARGASRGVDVVLAPPGVDTEAFRPDPEAPGADGRYFLNVGRLDDPRKNVGLLLDAFAAFRAKAGGDVRLVLAGASGPGPALLAKAAALGLGPHVDVRPSPSSGELVALYRRATAFVVSSDEEGLGLALLEAMACGAPAISTRCGGPEEIVEDGVNGWLVGPDDVSGLAERLAACARDPAERARRSIAARRTVIERYSAATAAHAFLASYDRLLAT